MQTPTLEDAESSLPAQKFTAPCVAPDFARGAVAGVADSLCPFSIRTSSLGQEWGYP